MRDDVFGLASLKFPVQPKPRSSAPRSQKPAVPLSFVNQLTRATTARETSGKPTGVGATKYVSPMLGSKTSPPPKPVPRATTTVTRPRPTPPTTLGATALPLHAYPHPKQDNGRGLHWIPTTNQSPAIVDRFVGEAQRMGVKWVTYLNNSANTGDNDYLVSKLVAAGIEPVMRIYSPTVQPLQGDIEGMVRHYAGMGVHYFQPFNEPNLNCENFDGKVSVDRYLDAWVPAARAIVRGGGLPGFGSLAPGGDYDDQQFLRASLAGLEARGDLGALDKAWLSMHNYTWNHPIDDRGDGDGFFKFRAYRAMLHDALGRDLPIIGTEGGTFEGQQEDPRMPAVTVAMAAEWTRQAFKYMRDEREPWLFASSVWTIADLAGGSSDPRFEAQALFRADGSQNSIVAALNGLA
jgi:hypothetical protein